ncbi:hypothetical protein HPB48_006657 [Haemaphysalis longicornis]|uniref:Sulfotransferase domain-containing protein n=1 Tax=Haemaphysalis longicornis TaxID=44386 RepID=A0A9J6GUP4_HAELO|nr:hypothetical protein HPB48_006657 [Haemaphysalis longicornis]
MSMQRKEPKYQIIDGVPRCVWIDPDILRENLKFKGKSGDVFVSTFPKSGTHWVQFIIQLILKKGEPVTTHKEFTDNMRLFEYSKCQEWASPLPLRAFLTHLPLSRCSMAEEAKYVYVARNPWDVCVSFFHMATNVSAYEFYDGTFQEFVEVFIGGNFGYGDYFEHVASGYALRNEPNVLFLTYEELKNLTGNAVLKLAHFLGEEYGKTLKDNDELLKQLLQRSTAESMRSVLVLDTQESLSKDWEEVLARKNHKCKNGFEGDENKYAFVRAAKVGGWREHFTPELLRRMECRIQECEKKSSVMELWKDIRAEAIEASKSSQ